MNVVGTCASAYDNDSTQTLAIVLSIVFSFYVGSALLLSSLQLYSVTNHQLSKSEELLPLVPVSS